jgi:hypothetical protein
MERKVFMVMPFSNEIARSAYEHSIKKVCESHRLEIRRADEIFTTTPIYDDIVKEIRSASIIIVDISDNNPNVYYELGMSHTLKPNQTIIITQGDYSQTPFDIAHFRIIKYQDSIVGKVELEKQLDLTLRSLLADYKTINKDKYSFAIDVLLAGQRQNLLATLLGIRDYSGVVLLEDALDMEFEYPGEFSRQRTSLINNAEPLIKLNYLADRDGIVDLTEEGKAFSEIVEAKGIKCHIFNGQLLTPGYESFEAEYWERKK